MNKKAQSTGIGIGVIIVAFVVIIVGVALFQAVAQEAGKVSATGTHNDSADGVVTTSPANGAAIDLKGQELLNTPVVWNGSSGLVITAGNYTIGERVSPLTGVKTIYYQSDAADYAAQPINITYEYGDDGYAESSGTRGVVGLIAIFFALAIAIVALEPTLRSGVLNAMGK